MNGADVSRRPGIVVIGSSNTDLIIKLPHLPKPGETVIGGTFSQAPGGKGANQAVAAARAGGNVTFIAGVGNDSFGREAISRFVREGINVGQVSVHENSPSGMALIFVDAGGENSIGVASGANAELQPSHLLPARTVIASAACVLLQLEIPLPTVEAAIRLASEAGVQVILNPAPARELSANSYQHISILTPNEHEAEVLTGVAVVDEASLARAASMLLDRGTSAVIITLGSRGAYIADGRKTNLVPAYRVTATDTTAAGDVFNGALAVALAQNGDIHAAVRFANAAAAISVTRLGAQPSAPRRTEIEEFIRQHAGS